MTDKVDSAIYIYDVEFDKIKTIKLKTFFSLILRVILFIIGLIVIFSGLYLESI